MEIELLVVPDCPNGSAARELIDHAVSDARVRPARVRTTVIGTDQEAVARGFIGSPTILIDGRDPFAVENGTVGLSCRLYSTPEGLKGLPARRDLRRELERAAARGEVS